VPEAWDLDRRYRPSTMWSTAGWELWRLPTRDGSCALFIAESGTSDVPVVVLHGGPGGDLVSVAGLVEGLERDRRVVLFDQRGSFRSPARIEALSFEALIDDLDHLIESLGGDQVDLVGHSMGAVLAAAYVASGGPRVRHMVLVGPGPLRVGDPHEAALLAAQLDERMRIETDPGWADVAHRFGLPADPDGLDPRVSARWMRLRDAWLFTTHPERHDQVVSVFFSRRSGLAIDATIPEAYDHVTPLQASPLPVTVIVGDRDLVDPGARLARHWFPDDGHVRCLVLEGCGHSPWVDAPDVVRRALLAGLGH
jgi:proline iminopeptidase